MKDMAPMRNCPVGYKVASIRSRGKSAFTDIKILWIKVLVGLNLAVSSLQ